MYMLYLQIWACKDIEIIIHTKPWQNFSSKIPRSVLSEQLAAIIFQRTALSDQFSVISHQLTAISSL